MSAANAAWEALNVALKAHAPACQGDDRFTDDGRAEGGNADLQPICGVCRVLAECRAYAIAEARAQIVGFWAGRRRGTRQAEGAAA